MEIAEIQRRMAQIRSDMHQEVQGAVRTAAALTSWQAMVRNYPWAALSAASLVGYLIVPRRAQHAPTIVTMGTPNSLMIPAGHAPTRDERKSSWTVMGTALSLAAPIAIRAAQNYALRYVEDWLTRNPLPMSAGRETNATGNEANRPAREGASNRLREYR
jgi:hypothetical protein